MAGELLSDKVIKEATAALKAGSGVSGDAEAIFAANKELLTLHELIAHRIFQVLVGSHRGRTFGK
jgi:xylose isomerase